MTVRRWIIKYIGAFIVPLVLVIFLIFSYIIYKMSYDSTELSKTTVKLYANQLEENMNSMERRLLTIYDNNMDLSYLIVSEDRDQINLSKIAYSNFLRRENLILDYFDGMFTIVQRADEWMYFDAGTSGREALAEECRRLVDSKDMSAWQERTWFVYNIDGVNYLMRVTQNGNNYCGAWICLDTMAEDIKRYCEIAGVEVVVLNKDNQIVSKTENGAEKLYEQYISKNILIKNTEFVNRYVAGNVENRYTGLNIVLFIPTWTILKQVYLLAAISCITLGCITLFIFMFWSRMKIKIIAPCNQLEEAMKDFETEEKLVLQPEPLYEFGVVENGFNQMKIEIRDLKIERYEQQIKEQEIHMKYLFGQMQPHFFLNALNVIYSFAEIERYDLIQKLSLVMVRYLRYVFNNGNKPVMLKEEISHMEDYIAIQQMRYPDRVFFETDIEEELETVGVLPFLLQTFVENSVKYGLQDDKENKIKVIAHKENNMISLIIEDNGKGFTEAQLEELNKEDYEPAGVTKVGISNTRQRLKLMYGEKCGMHLENAQTGGAIVKITFPIQ